jgi:hypothetical protein
MAIGHKCAGVDQWQLSSHPANHEHTISSFAEVSWQTGATKLF